MRGVSRQRDQICETPSVRAASRHFNTDATCRAPIIKRFLEPLHRDLKDIHHHINHNNTRKPSIHVVDQVRYLVVYKAKLDGFRAKLPTHRASISAMHDLMEFQTPSARRESIVKLEELVGELEARQDADDSTETTHPELAKGEEFTIGSRLSKCT